MIIAIHDLNLASMYADQLLMLKDGISVSCGSPESVLTKNVLTETYNTSFHIITHPDGYPWVMPNVDFL